MDAEGRFTLPLLGGGGGWDCIFVLLEDLVSVPLKMFKSWHMKGNSEGVVL